MNKCKICGRAVRLGAEKIRVNRMPGVMHYIAHADYSPMHDGKWLCSMMKPYPKDEAGKPYFQMVQRWNVENKICRHNCLAPGDNIECKTPDECNLRGQCMHYLSTPEEP